MCYEKRHFYCHLLSWECFLCTDMPHYMLWGIYFPLLFIFLSHFSIVTTAKCHEAIILCLLCCAETKRTLATRSQEEISLRVVFTCKAHGNLLCDTCVYLIRVQWPTLLCQEIILIAFINRLSKILPSSAMTMCYLIEMLIKITSHLECEQKIVRHPGINETIPFG